jgi:hypothetical protein
MRNKWLAMILASALLSLAVAAAAAGAASGGGTDPTALRKVRSATKLVAKVPSPRFAKHRRTRVLRDGRTAVSTVSRGTACHAALATDVLLSDLLTPTTWAHHRAPSKLLRKPLTLLRAAEKRLLHRAGRSCSRAGHQHVLTGHHGGAGAHIVKPPKGDPEQGGDLDHPMPAGTFRPPHSLGGGSALGADPHTADDARRSVRGGDPLTFFRISDSGVPPRQASPQEPTEAIGRHVVWYTGNTSVALSTNDGRTFHQFNPSNVLPDSGLAFCCDQLVSYSPSANLFVWVMQYWCNENCLRTGSDGKQYCQTNGAYNRIRIAVARPEDLIAHASNPGLAWSYWDITPSTLGLPANTWFDRSDLSVNDWYANWTVDTLCANPGSVAGRISLAQLAARGTVTLSYFEPGGRLSAAQGGAGTSTSYFTAGQTDSQTRVWSWAAYSGTVFPHDINHSSVPTWDNTTSGSNSGNWYDRYGIFPGEVETSTLTGNTLYVAQGTGRAYCTAHCSGTGTPTLHHVFDQPAVLVTKFNTSSWTESGERWLWNPTLAFGWPAMQTDGDGDVGIALVTAAAGHNAQPVAGFLTPSEQFTYALPEGRPFETGDYYSLRPGRTAQSFLMPGMVVQNDAGGPAMHWYSIEYGHGATPYVSPPTVHITAPSNHASYANGATAHFTASVSDPVDGSLPAAAIVWTEDGSVIGTGTSISHVESKAGSHTIEVTATNGDGKSASDVITIQVQAPVGALSVQITQPDNGHNFGYSPFNQGLGKYCQDIQFTTSVSGAVNAVTYTWNDEVTDGNTEVESDHQVATGASPTITLCAGSYENTYYTHNLTVSATDGTNVNDAFVSVEVASYYLG